MKKKYHRIVHSRANNTPCTQKSDHDVTTASVCFLYSSVVVTHTPQTSDRRNIVNTILIRRCIAHALHFCSYLTFLFLDVFLKNGFQYTENIFRENLNTCKMPMTLVATICMYVLDVVLSHRKERVKLSFASLQSRNTLKV